MLQGLKLTFRHLFYASRRRKPLSIDHQNYFDQQNGLVTTLYPHETIPVPDNGRYRLYNEIDDCIVCDLCAKICPVNCIEIEAIKSTEEIGKTSDGSSKRLYAGKFDIDMAKCCFCGLCTTVCPTECLTMTKTYDFPEFDVFDMTYHFTDLSPEEAEKKREIYEESQRIKAELKKQKEQEARETEASAPTSGAKPAFKPSIKPIAKSAHKESENATEKPPVTKPAIKPLVKPTAPGSETPDSGESKKPVIRPASPKSDAKETEARKQPKAANPGKPVIKPIIKPVVKPATPDMDTPSGKPSPQPEHNKPDDANMEPAKAAKPAIKPIVRPVIKKNTPTPDDSTRVSEDKQADGDMKEPGDASSGTEHLNKEGENKTEKPKPVKPIIKPIIKPVIKPKKDNEDSKE